MPLRSHSVKSKKRPSRKCGMTVSPGDILTADDVAQVLHVRRVTALDLARRGDLRGFRDGRSWRFHAAVVTDYIDAKRAAATRRGVAAMTAKRRLNPPR